ncbi:hypothetical protein Mpsy_0317 [Methanolobus psychrophilus R15]|nr:hypothetical protein Mpsy_0317 [Methanolobus psychrophilus R15]
MFSMVDRSSGGSLELKNTKGRALVANVAKDTAAITTSI